MEHYVSIAILGLVQGLAEFLPVSSSGHLRILENYLKTPDGISVLTLEVLLHSGTLLAVLIWLRADIYDFCFGFFNTCKRCVGRKLDDVAHNQMMIFLFVFAGSIPTAFIGVGLKKAGVEHLGVKAVAGFLIITGIFNFFVRRGDDEDISTSIVEGLTFPKVLFIGICQGLAVLPGISRSGATIAAGKFCGIPVERAARFSFLLSVPAVGGATLLTIKDLLSKGGGTSLDGLFVLLIGAAIAFCSGLLALNWLFAALDKDKFHLFAYYCWVIAIIVFFVG